MERRTKINMKLQELLEKIKDVSIGSYNYSKDFEEMKDLVEEYQFDYNFAEIFDETEAGIDLWSFINLINVFKELREKNNSKTIIISHQERIINIADRVVLLQDGKISDGFNEEELFSSCPKLGGQNE